MPKRAHELAWTVSIKPPGPNATYAARVAIPGGEIEFMLTSALAAMVSAPVMCCLHGLEPNADDIVLVGISAALFSFKYDVYEEPRYDGASRHYLLAAMPIFAHMACWVTGFAAYHNPDAVFGSVGLAFTALLSLQCAATFLARGLLHLIPPQDA